MVAFHKIQIQPVNYPAQMYNSSSDSVAVLTDLPPLTVGNLLPALLGLPLIVVLLGVTNTDLDTIYTMGIHWALAFIVLGIAVRGEGLSWPQLGFRRPSLIDIGYIIVTAVAIILVYSVTPPLIEAIGLPTSESGGLVGGSTGIGVAIAYAVTIGIVEEILYRGYPIERLLSYTDSSLVAGGVTWLIFTAVHAINWPLGSLLQTSLVAAVLTVIYLRRRTLAPVVGAHVLVWVFVALGQYG
jgi:membrane protease YdiL (CAAX protease family)